MNAKDVISEIVEFGHVVMRLYVGDLTDDELLVRPVPGSNHAAWQVGHLIGSTCGIVESLGHEAPPLPDGFEPAHSRETAGSDDPGRFATRDEYLALMDRVKAASLAAVEATDESALGEPAPESMREYAPTVSSALLLLGTHWLMHAGQVAVVRRKLGKPPLF
jgi:hypothetical protein